MSREIKFRAWLSDRMAYNVGFHPYMSVNLVAADIAEKGEFQNRDEQFIWSPGLCEIMQFTGLKDKNGVEIYEGDIVKCNTKNNHQWEHEGPVVYLNQSASFAIYCGKNYISEEEEDLYTWFGHNENFEVIGNIYQSA